MREWHDIYEQLSDVLATAELRGGAGRARRRRQVAKPVNPEAGGPLPNVPAAAAVNGIAFLSIRRLQPWICTEPLQRVNITPARNCLRSCMSIHFLLLEKRMLNARLVTVLAALALAVGMTAEMVTAGGPPAAATTPAKVGSVSGTVVDK